MLFALYILYFVIIKLITNHCMGNMTDNSESQITCMRRFFILASLLILFLLLPSFTSAAQDKKNVLYLNSYHNGYYWSDGLLEGVRSVLNNSRYKVDLQIEYMDAKKFNYDIISKDLLTLYREKFKNESFDIVILSDNDALNFINQHRQELFPDIPVVFCGVNDLKDADVAAGNITGVVELFDLTATLNVAKKIHPEKDSLIVLIDSSTAGRAIQRQIEKITRENDSGLKIDFWVQLSLAETKKRVRQLPNNTFLFIAPYYQTINGQFYTSEEVSEAIYEHSSVPIYTAWEFMVGHGAVGGKVLSSFEHGRTAGEIALRILDGTRVDDIPVIREPQGINLFDYKVMDKLGINQQLLPGDRQIINFPKAEYSLSKELFWTIMVSLILLLLALVSMLGAMLERRKVEMKITDQLAFQGTLMDTIPQLVSWKDVKGKYLGANQAFMDFFGIQQTRQVVGKTTGEIVNDTSYGKWSGMADASVVENDRAFRKIRKKVTGNDNNESWLEVNKVPLRGQDGNIVGVLSTAENITKEQNLEKQLLQSQKMEAIGTLAGGIAHDFNNILTSIINSTELAIGDLTPGSQTEADLNRVLKAARRGAGVVQQILSFSRPSREGFLSTDINQVVQEVVHLLEASTPANISIFCHVEADQNYFVHANPTQIHQALLNLCTNAYHALGKSGGAINIALSRIKQDSASDKFIRLLVIDDGSGIAPEIIDKIFDPFFSTKSKAEGTGLGLAVVHGIVESHQGTIRVFCGEEGGAMFEILLPESRAGEDVISSSSGGTSVAGGHILFVEDDEDQLDTTPRLLENMGYSVTALRESEAALQLISAGTHHFDIMITDFDMPAMSGAELAGQCPDLPVILLSGRDDAQTAAREYQNIHKVIIKPYHKKDLMDSIREVIQSGKMA